MEEDSGVKAPVTRLRRRLSVEQSEESKSPAPSTPTKARRARRKPELELIEENSTAKTTTLITVAKEIVEEEKPVTPSRRSARIRSNTSIVSETAVVDSPRAKRAARRLSQVGSDTEGPTTPARQTRRTRKDSTSSIDKAESQVSVKQNTIPELITEENEANNKPPVSPSIEGTNESSKPVRKSPRLQEKKGRKSETSPEKTKNEDFNKSINNSDQETKETERTEASVNQASKTNDVNIQSPVKKTERLSIGSAELLKSISAKPSQKTSSLNKSTSALINLTESKRSRTKSCTVSTLSATANDNTFYSDSESTNKRRKSNNRTPLKQLNISGSNKSLNKSTNKQKSFTETTKNDTNTQKEKSDPCNDNSNDIQNIFKQNPSSDMQVTITFEDSDSNPEKLNRAEDDQCVPEVDHINEDSNKFSTTNKDNSTAENNPINDTCEPMDVDETIPDHLLIDHSQKIENKSMQSPQKSKRKSSIGQNLDAVESHNKSNSVLSDQKNISSSETNISKQNTSKESKRKSSISQSLNESENQNKSTLVLSHLKDISESETNKSSKSPQQLNDKRHSNSSTVLNITQENIVTNKNLSLCYSTSTPLQQKGSRKINVNASNIKSPGENKLLVSKTKDSDSESDSSESNENKGNLNVSKKQKYDSSESSDESSQEKSNLMDDEAEDAGHDYESGDSQDEEERKEALANEIREKGETLTSDEEFSDDSDYEKDSFIVSSAEEDNEMLEGTEDDLSMSDNELNMSKKSKQKYNERKLKEQKKASREMFESRHQINNSKTEKKKKRIQLNSSSESESDNEVKKTSKAKTGQILDSSADITTNSQRNTSNKIKSQSISSSESDYEISKPFKVKNKQRLDSENMNISNKDNTKMSKREKTPSQSICDESVGNNEKEMSINLDHVANESDPLSQSIKMEPKTPLKENNMSVAFIDAQNSTNVSITEGDKLDPLAPPVANDDDNDDSSMSSDSDTERIVQDYDSILRDLNKDNKIKSVDTSLNFEKKTKKKDKDPIVDQLNLTQVKGKKSKNQLEVTKKEKSKETKVLQANDDDESSSSSESALMNLLFSEESNHCDEVNTKNADDSSDYISLKRVAGKTDIHDSGTGIQENCHSNKTPKDKKNKNRTLSDASFTQERDADDSVMNKSATKTPKSDKKKKQKKISVSQATDTNSDDGSLKFFIDTEGSSAQNISMEKMSLNRSKTSVSEKDNDSDSEAPMEVSFKKDKNLSNSKIDNLDKGSLNLPSSIGSSKKKKKQNMDNTTTETKDTSESAKKKKKKISISFNESLTTAEIDTIESTKTLNENTPVSGKKIRNNSNVDARDEIDAVELSINKSILKTPSSDKKKKKSIDVVPSEDTKTEITPILVTPGSAKKTQKNEIGNENCPDVTVLDMSLKTSSSKKKQKKISETSQNETEIIPILATPGSAKKTQKNETGNENGPDVTVLDTSLKTSSGKKKQKISETSQNETEITPILVTPGSAKKTQKNETGNENGPEGESDKLSKAQKRKRKISSLISEEDHKDPIEKETFTSNKQKKIKLTPQNMTEENITESLKGTKTKKRKEREDDNIETATQALKENSLKKVSRLPTSILEQLDEKPRQEEPKRKKSKLISTTDFIVEENKIRKNKPSMYLEESIYLNEDEKELKKQKAKNVKPKVLPFVPTASTSISGFTTNFKVNVIPRDTKFVAQSNSVTNFKSEYLYGKKIKRNRTYEMYKKSRNVKLSKF